MLSRLKSFIYIASRKLFSVLQMRIPVLHKLLPMQLKFRLSSDTKELKDFQKILPFQPNVYQEGINLIGYLKAQMGLGQGARLYASAIKMSNIPYRLLNFSAGNPSKQNESMFNGMYSKKPLYNTNIFHINADQLPLLKLMYPKSTWDKRYNVSVWLWELEEFPTIWLNAFDYADEIWTPSTFSSESIAKISPKPVITIPYGIHVETCSNYDREYFGLPQDKFLFLCMYDVNSMMSRKNPISSIDAFIAAFGLDHPDVALVIKINNANTHDLAKLSQHVLNSNNILIINKKMSKIEVHSLIKSCDAFISLHRSEGFGLVMAEAMYLGVPVIATNWSANTDFMNNNNSCLVDFKFIDVGYNYYQSKPGQRWADPDIEHAAFYMKKLFSDLSFHKQVAENGQAYIQARYSLNKCAQKIIHRLTEIGTLSKTQL